MAQVMIQFSTVFISLGINNLQISLLPKNLNLYPDQILMVLNNIKQSRPQAEANNTLRDLHNSSYDTKAELITVLSFIQNNSWFKNIAKTCLPPSIHRCSVYLRQCTFMFVQLRKYCPNSRCRAPSCPLDVFAMFLTITSSSSICVHFCFNNQNNSTSFPGLLG